VDAARIRYEEGLETLRATGDRSGAVWAAIHLGAAVAALGDAARGRALLEDGLAGAQALGEQVAEAWALRHLAVVACDGADPAAARVLLTRSLAISQEIGDRRHSAHLLELLGEVAAALGHLGPAVRLAGSANAHRAALGAPHAPRDAARLQRWLEPALAAAGDAGQAAWEAGQADASDRAVGAVLAVLAGSDAADAAAPLAPPGRHRPRPPDPLKAPSRGGGGLRPDARSPRRDGRPAPADALTPRELEVAALVARGLTNRQIAATLMISAGTAANHVEHIRDKLGCRSRARVAAWAAAREL
jgi:DNA-binding CsgD family transcriptional regulator